MHWFLPSRAANGHWNAAHCTENLFIQTFCLHGGLQSVASLYTWRLTAVDWTDGFVRKPGSTSEQRRHLNFSHWILDESVRRLIKVASQSCVTLGRLAPFYICSCFVKKDLRARFSRGDGRVLHCSVMNTSKGPLLSKLFCCCGNNHSTASPLDRREIQTQKAEKTNNALFENHLFKLE